MNSVELENPLNLELKFSNNNVIELKKFYTLDNPLCILKSNYHECEFKEIGLPVGFTINKNTGVVTGCVEYNLFETINILFTSKKKINNTVHIKHLKTTFTYVNVDMIEPSNTNNIDNTVIEELSILNTNNVDNTVIEELSILNTNNIDNYTIEKPLIMETKPMNEKLLIGLWDIYWTVDNINEPDDIAICRCVLKLKDVEPRDLEENGVNIENIIGSRYGEEHWPPVWLSVSDIGKKENIENLRNKLLGLWPNNIFDYGIYNYSFENNKYQWFLCSPPPNNELTSKHFYDIDIINDNQIQGKIVDGNYPLDNSGKKHRLFYGKRVTDIKEIKQLTQFSYMRQF